jgi:hypothetical protein
LRAIVDGPRESDPRRQVVLVDREVLRVWVRAERSGRRHIEQVVPDPEEQLHPPIDLPVVLDEQPIEGRIVGGRKVAEILLKGGVAESIDAADGGQVRIVRGKRVIEPLAPRSVVADELCVDACLEPVLPPDPGHVVDDLPDPLIEIEAVRRRITDPRAAEIGHTRHRDRGTVDCRFVERTELMTPRELDTQLVELVGTHCRYELNRGGVHAIAEVSGAIRRDPWRRGHIGNVGW